MQQKEQKLKEAIRELAAEYFSRESNRTSLITITDVELKSRNSKAVILFTVLPSTQEAAVLDFMHRQLSDFREYVSSHARLMRVPFFDVAIDMGEKNRQKIDEVSRRIPE
jgi:ribosome-binding factor A